MLKLNGIVTLESYKMRNLLIVLIIFWSITGCSTPQVEADHKLDRQIRELQGATLGSILDRLGPPFDVVEDNGRYRLVMYRMHTKSSGLTFVPVVGLIADGNAHLIQRCELTFSSTDIFDGQPNCEEAEGFTSMYAMPSNEGMLGTGGVRDQVAYQRLGRFLASKSQFFNQERWKIQNVANNYYRKYSQK